MLTQEGVQKVQRAFGDTNNRLVFIFQALGDSTRLKIFQLLSHHKDLCVTDIAKVCHISVPAASYQLKLMEVVGLVTKERTGKMICYELKKDDSFVKIVKKIVS